MSRGHDHFMIDRYPRQLAARPLAHPQRTRKIHCMLNNKLAHCQNKIHFARIIGRQHVKSIDNPLISPLPSRINQYPPTDVHVSAALAADALAALALATTMSHRCATPFSSSTFRAVSGDLHSCCYFFQGEGKRVCDLDAKWEHAPDTCWVKQFHHVKGMFVCGYRRSMLQHAQTIERHLCHGEDRTDRDVERRNPKGPVLYLYLLIFVTLDKPGLQPSLLNSMPKPTKTNEPALVHPYGVQTVLAAVYERHWRRRPSAATLHHTSSVFQRVIKRNARFDTPARQDHVGYIRIKPWAVVIEQAEQMKPDCDLPHQLLSQKTVIWVVKSFSSLL